MSTATSLRARGAALLLLALLLSGALPAAAQRLQGRVTRGGEAVGNVAVELHRVTRDSAGVVSRTQAGPDGSFAFTLPPADPTGFTVLIATAEYLGVRYFGNPIHSSETLSGYTVQVFDTLTATPANAPLRVVRRDVIVLPEKDGGAEVNEVLQILNPTGKTLVAPQGMPLWAFGIPAGAGAFEAGEGKIGPESVQRMGDRVFLTGSFVPGAQELFIRYRLARGARRTALPVAPATDTMNLFVRQSADEAKVAGLAPPALVEVEGEKFLRYSGAGIGGRKEVVLEWKRASAPPVDPRLAAVGVTGILLAVGAGMAVRRGRKA
ncbi:MAG: hypothetical protein M3P24_11885 [Gemmatimonadota bacterium]|nr:hypothetical protein [Gemmatimonadota bacterium]